MSHERSYQKTGKSHQGEHHIIPRSRGGSDDPVNLYHWQGNHGLKHAAWHALFENEMPEEVISRILTWERKDGELDMRYFRSRKGVNEEKLRWWKILFGDMKPREAVEWIRREFIRKEWYR